MTVGVFNMQVRQFPTLKRCLVGCLPRCRDYEIVTVAWGRVTTPRDKASGDVTLLCHVVDVWRRPVHDCRPIASSVIIRRRCHAPPTSTVI